MDLQVKTSLIWSIAINIRRNRKYFYDDNLICWKTGSHNFAFQQPFARWHQFNTTTNKTHFVFPFIFSCGYSKEAYLTRFAAMLQNLLLVLVARFTLAFSLQCRRFLRSREFFFLRKRHVETTVPILLCHKIKDGGYNNTNMNKLSSTQNTLALRLANLRRLISHYIGWLLRGQENHIG